MGGRDGDAIISVEGPEGTISERSWSSFATNGAWLATGVLAERTLPNGQSVKAKELWGSGGSLRLQWSAASAAGEAQVKEYMATIGWGCPHSPWSPYTRLLGIQSAFGIWQTLRAEI